MDSYFRAITFMVAICGVVWGQDSETVQQATDASNNTIRSGEAEIPYHVLLNSMFQMCVEYPSEELTTVIQNVQRQGGENSRRNSALTEAIHANSAWNPRLRCAMNKCVADADNALALQMLSVLTDEQKSLIRKRNRSEIQQTRQSQTLETPRFGLSGNETVGQLLQHHDLLTVVSVPDLEDKLELSDEQFEVIKQISKAADADAERVIKDCIDCFNAPSPDSPASVRSTSRAAIKLEETMQVILTEKQSALYEKHCEQHQERVKTAIARSKEDAIAFMYKNPLHGALAGMHSVMTADGQTEEHFTCHNFFAVPEHAKEFEITDEQQTEIAAALEMSEVATAEEVRERNEAVLAIANSARPKVLERIRQHHDLTFAEINDLLTERQRAVLEKIRIRSLGPQMFTDAQVQAALEFSDDQEKQIGEILSRRPALIDESPLKLIAIPPNSSGEDNSKQMAEFRKRSQDLYLVFQENERVQETHIRQQGIDLRELLMEEQLELLQQMTGLSSPPNF